MYNPVFVVRRSESNCLFFKVTVSMTVNQSDPEFGQGPEVDSYYLFGHEGQSKTGSLVLWKLCNVFPVNTSGKICKVLKFDSLFLSYIIIVKARL